MMRIRTLILSFLVHSAMIGAAAVAWVFDTTGLPQPPRSTSFIMAVAAAPNVEPSPARRRQSSASTVHPDAAPVEVPDGLARAPDDLPDEAPDGAGVIVGAGDLTGDLFGTSPPPQPHRVGGVVRPPQKVHHVAPVYPPMAQSARVGGTVMLEALIAEDGSVRDVKILQSVALLDAAVVEAVRQWRYTPTLLNGVPVQVIVVVTVMFSLK